MADLLFKIDGKIVPPPNNYRELEIEVDFANNKPDATIKTSMLEWDGENAKTLNLWFKKGLSGGLGIFEGPGLQILACSPPSIVFDGCIDMTSPQTRFQCDVVTASVKETQRIQFLNDRAEGFTFAYLKSIGVISKANYVAVPYVISNIPDYLQVAILVVSFLELVKVIRDAVEELIYLADKIIADTSAGAASTFSVAAFIILIAWDVILIALYALYTVFIITLAVGIFLMLIDNIIQKIKYKYGMKVRDLFAIAANYLGLAFKSSILDSAPYNNLVIVPVKSSYFNDSTYQDGFMASLLSATINRKHYDDTENSNAYGYYDGTFGKLIREMQDYFNGTDQGSQQTGVVIRSGTLYFERWDYWNNVASFLMPDQSSDAPFEDPYGTNASELSANYQVIYEQDNMDENTYDRYDGTSCLMTLKPNMIGNKKNVLLTGLTYKQLAYALAKSKKDLTVPEQVVNAILGAISGIYNDVVGALNTLGFNLSSLPPNITNSRIDAMLLSSDFTGVQKILVVQTSSGTKGGVPICKIDPDNSRADHTGHTDAYQIQKKFHAVSWAIDTINGGHNQYYKYADKEIPLCCNDFSKIKDNNIIKSVKNLQGRIDSLRWNPFMETARTDFRVKNRYTNNLSQTISIDGSV